MSAKPVARKIVVVCGLICAAGAAHADTPLVLVFARPAGDEKAMRALSDVRKALRADGRFSVLTFDPDAPAVKRAAADAHHPEWLTQTLTTDADKLAPARALGASFIAIVTPGKSRGRADVHLMETLPASRVWDVSDQKPDAAAHAVATQAADALKPPPVVAPTPVTNPPPVSTTPTPDVKTLPPAVPNPPAVPTSPPVDAPPTPAGTIPTPVAKTPTVVLPSPVPAGTPTKPVLVPTPIPGPTKVILPIPITPTTGDSPDDLSSVSGTLASGDAAMGRSDAVAAIALYRQAINNAPRSAIPRLKLAQAYLVGGLRDKALDEARRALEVAPDNLAVQQFLSQWDAETGSGDGSVARYQALVARRPDDAAAHLSLGDAYWNNGALPDAEGEYKTAQKLLPGGAASGRLARLYAALSRYEDSLAALQSAGAGGYALALSIVQNRADTLSSTLSASREAFAGGKITRENFYDSVKTASEAAQALADFVAKITPPAAYKLSHLHRKLATDLLAQEGAVLVRYVETSDDAQASKAAQLEKDSQTEMLTAHAAEQKLGLWKTKE